MILQTSGIPIPGFQFTVIALPPLNGRTEEAWFRNFSSLDPQISPYSDDGNRGAHGDNKWEETLHGADQLSRSH